MAGQSPKKPKNPRKSKAAIKAQIREIIETEIEQARLAEFRLRENVRQALGVGNYRDFIKETENGFASTVPQQPNAPTVSKPSVRRLSKRKKRKSK